MTLALLLAVEVLLGPCGSGRRHGRWLPLGGICLKEPEGQLRPDAAARAQRARLGLQR